MFFKADICIKEVSSPFNCWCSSGHQASKLFKRDGVNLEATRFFQVSGDKVDGIYCEPCLVIANYLSSKRKI